MKKRKAARAPNGKVIGVPYAKIIGPNKVECPFCEKPIKQSAYAQHFLKEHEEH